MTLVVIPSSSSINSITLVKDQLAKFYLVGWFDKVNSSAHSNEFKILRKNFWRKINRINEGSIWKSHDPYKAVDKDSIYLYEKQPMKQSECLTRRLPIVPLDRIRDITRTVRSR